MLRFFPSFLRAIRIELGLHQANLHLVRLEKAVLSRRMGSM
jgi:hypothetical protein